MKYLVIFFVLFVLFGCSSSFYQPDDNDYGQPESFGVKSKDISFKSKDGTLLHGLHLIRKDINKPAKGMITFFHSGKKNITQHFKQVSWLTDFGYDLILWDYRGFGKSAGIASYKGVYQDGIAALNWSYQNFIEGNYEKFILFAQGLGVPTMIKSLEEFKYSDHVDYLILDSGYISYKRVAMARMKRNWYSTLFRFYPYLFVSDKYSPDQMIYKIQKPVLLVHGEDDKSVPIEFSEEIFEKLGTNQKWLWRIKKGIHLDAFQSHNYIYRKKLIEFFDEFN